MSNRPTMTCAKCAKPIWASATSRPQGEATCQPCRALVHGANRYKAGCRCDECREAVRSHLFEWRAGQRAQGKPARPARIGSGVTGGTRREVYARDGWICQICERPVARDGDPNGNWAPSVDHLIPRISALVPNNSADGLRLAHRLCNALRKDDIRSDVEVRQIIGRRHDFADLAA